MIDIEALTEEDIGKWVVYTDVLGSKEYGRLKSYNRTNIFVVFKCNNNWDDYQNYTGCSCNPNDLNFRFPN